MANIFARHALITVTIAAVQFQEDILILLKIPIATIIVADAMRKNVMCVRIEEDIFVTVIL